MPARYRCHRRWLSSERKSDFLGNLFRPGHRFNPSSTFLLFNRYPPARSTPLFTPPPSAAVQSVFFSWNDADSFRYTRQITVDTISFMSTTAARSPDICFPYLAFSFSSIAVRLRSSELSVCAFHFDVVFPFLLLLFSLSHARFFFFFFSFYLRAAELFPTLRWVTSPLYLRARLECELIDRSILLRERNLKDTRGMREPSLLRNVVEFSLRGAWLFRFLSVLFGK